MSISLDLALPRVKQSEGYRPMPYRDTVGVETIGYGCALTVGWPEPFAAAVCKLQLEMAESECAANIIGWADLDFMRQSVLIEMAFNLGYSKLSQFHDLMRAIKNKDWKAAAEAMLDSRWAIQVKGRAVRLARLMETGTDL
jgi:lysozyme